MILCEILLGALPLFAQEDPQVLRAAARVHADEARQKCAGLLEGMEGVAGVGMGGTGNDYRLLITVRDFASKARALEALGGETYEGLPILWWVRPPVSIAPPAPVPPPAPSGSTVVAEPRPVPSGPSAYDCDIIRDHLKLKRISHPTGNGKYWAPCQVMKRTVEGGGINPPPVLYSKHRPDCPVYLGRAAQPPVADAFVAWVYQQGVTVITPAGTPQLSDLRPGLNPPPPAYPTYSSYYYYPPYPYYYGRPHISWVHTYRGWIPHRTYYHYPGYCRFRRW